VAGLVAHTPAWRLRINSSVDEVTIVCAKVRFGPHKLLIMTKATTLSKKGADKLVTKVGRSLGTMKAAVVEWMVGPTPGVARAAIDWKMEVFKCTKIAARKCVSSRNDTMLLQKVYKMLRPRILVYEKPDPIVMAEIAPMFLHYHDSGKMMTVEDLERLFLEEGDQW